MNRQLFICVALMSLVLIIGCSKANNDTNHNDHLEQPSIVEQDTNMNENEQEKPVEGEVETPNPIEDNPTETTSDIMTEFYALVENKTPVAEIKNFVDDLYGKVSPQDTTTMVITLEDIQEDQLLGLEDRYYADVNLQEEFWELGYSGFDFSQLDQITNPELKKLLTDTYDSGYKVETAEGTYFPVIDYEQYLKYQDHVSEDVQAYIHIKAIESKDVALKDAGLIIGWDEAISRAVRQEAFLMRYPNSTRIDEIRRLFGGYVYVTFNGVDNTPLFSYEDDMIDPEVSSAYTKAVSAGTVHSAYLDRIRTFIDLVEKNNNQQNEEVMNYQQETTELWSNYR